MATASRALHRPPDRLGLVLHPERDPGPVLEVAARWASRHGASVAACGWPSPPELPRGVEHVSAAELARRSDLLVAADGDGTLLEALRLGAGRGLAVLGVSPAHMDGALDAIADGRYAVESRSALLLVGPGRAPGTAFDDIVLRRESDERPATLAVHVDGELFTRHSGDGLIVATSGGSTGSSLSAGGPIVSAELAAAVLTPLAPRSPSSRPMVLADRQRLRVEVPIDGATLSIEIDGHAKHRGAPGEHMHIIVVPGLGRLIRLEQREL
jgi:NAD+ kinase